MAFPIVDSLRSLHSPKSTELGENSRFKEVFQLALENLIPE